MTRGCVRREHPCALLLQYHDARRFNLVQDEEAFYRRSFLIAGYTHTPTGVAAFQL